MRSVGAQELCENQGGRPGGRLPVPDSPYDLWWRNATLNWGWFQSGSGAVWNGLVEVTLMAAWFSVPKNPQYVDITWSNTEQRWTRMQRSMICTKRKTVAPPRGKRDKLRSYQPKRVHAAAAELAGYAYGASEFTFFFFSLPKEIMYIFGIWLIGFFFFFRFFSVLLFFKNGFTETIVHVVWQHTVSVSRLRNNTKLLHVRRHDGYDSILIFRWAACLCYGNWHFSAWMMLSGLIWCCLKASMNTQRATWYSVFTQSSRPSIMNYLLIRIKYKVVCMCFSAINGSGPAYLSELLHVYTPSRTLRSSSDTRMLEIQQYKRKTHGFRTFSCFGPHIWNSLPQDLRHCSTLSAFKAKLKTFLFSQYFHPN